jgi:hypothetical protein
MVAGAAGATHTTRCDCAASEHGAAGHTAPAEAAAADRAIVVGGVCAPVTVRVPGHASMDDMLGAACAAARVPSDVCRLVLPGRVSCAADLPAFARAELCGRLLGGSGRQQPSSTPALLACVLA